MNLQSLNSAVLADFHGRAQAALPLTLENLAAAVMAEAGPEYPAAALVAAVLRLSADLAGPDAKGAAWGTAKAAEYGKAALRPLLAAIPPDLLAEESLIRAEAEARGDGGAGVYLVTVAARYELRADSYLAAVELAQEKAEELAAVAGDFGAFETAALPPIQETPEGAEYARADLLEYLAAKAARQFLSDLLAAAKAARNDIAAQRDAAEERAAGLAEELAAARADLAEYRAELAATKGGGHV